VPDPPFRWRRVRGPWFDNNLAELALDGDALSLRWCTGRVHGDAHDRPVLETVATVRVAGGRVRAAASRHRVPAL
jgi:hypothetical protein